MYKWYKDDFDEAFYLERENGKVICGLHPQPTKEYAFHLLRKFFDTEADVQTWYTRENFWYGGIAPEDMSDRELLMRIHQMINNVYI